MPHPDPASVASNVLFPEVHKPTKSPVPSSADVLLLHPSLFPLCVILTCGLTLVFFRKLLAKYKPAKPFLATQFILGTSVVSLFIYYVEIVAFKIIFAAVIAAEAARYFLGVEAASALEEMIAFSNRGIPRFRPYKVNDVGEQIQFAFSFYRGVSFLREIRSFLTLFGIRLSLSSEAALFFFRPKMIAVNLLVLFGRAAVEEHAKWYITKRYRQTSLFRRARTDLCVWMLSGAAVGLGFGIVEGVSMSFFIHLLYSDGISNDLVIALMLRVIAGVFVNVATQVVAAAAATRLMVLGNTSIDMVTVKIKNVVIHGVVDLVFLLGTILRLGDWDYKHLILFAVIEVGVFLNVICWCWDECRKVGLDNHGRRLQ